MTYPHPYFECFKYVKGLLKHHEFAWDFCDFASIGKYSQKKLKFIIWWFHGDFSKFQRYNFQALSTHYETSFTMLSTLATKVITIEALHNLWCILHLSKLTKPKFSYFLLACLMTMTLLITLSNQKSQTKNWSSKSHTFASSKLTKPKHLRSLQHLSSQWPYWLPLTIKKTQA